MNPANILMCVNIPRGIKEDLLGELFCVAGPIEDISISRSGRACFIVYEFGDAVATAKELFQGVKLYGRPIELLSHDDIQSIHREQLEEEQPGKLEYNIRNPTKRFTYEGDFRNDRSNQFHCSDFTPPVCHKQFPIECLPPDLKAARHKRFPIEGDCSTSNVSPSSQNDETLPNPSENPYSEPVSRNSFAHFSPKTAYFSGGDSSRNLEPNPFKRKHDHRERYSHSKDDFSPNHAPYQHSLDRIDRKFHHPNRHERNDYLQNQISDDIFPIEDETVEQKYEDSIRRQFHDTPKKHSDDRFQSDNFKNKPSTSSDYIIRNEFREYDRSPYPRNQNYHRNKRNYNSKPQHHHNKEFRNRHR